MDSQVLDFQVLQMLNNPDSYQQFTIKVNNLNELYCFVFFVYNCFYFFLQAESSDTMNLDTKLFNPSEPTTSTMYLNQSIELGHGSLDNKPVQVSIFYNLVKF